MTWSTGSFILFVLACPLMMFWMMRGGHGHGGHGAAGHGCGQHNGHSQENMRLSADDLRRQRDELDRLIEEREQKSRSAS